uniref:Transmembrane protein 11, mitochondrial n=1 Tax=Mesocestoides corti TaxID=53468 RepID=A0A5K3F2S4_MESCO
MVGSKKTFAVIRAVYEHHCSPEDFVRELDFVLEKNVNVVIIEPDELGEVTWRWIHTGNWLHKTAVLAGFAAIAGTFLAVLCEGHGGRVATSLTTVPRGISTSLLPSVFFGLASATSSSLYALFWQWDPCAKYQVAKSLSSLPSCVVAAASVSTSGSSSSNEASQQTPARLSTHHCHSSKSSCCGAAGCGHCAELGQRPVVLIRRDDFYRKVMHNTVSIGAIICVWLAVYRWR